jgi:ABC-2 type transport system permease protein
MWSALLAVMAKEYRQTFRDKRMVMLLTVAPILQLILLGFAVNLDVNHVPTVVADEDRSAESRQLRDAIVAGDTFDEAVFAERAESAIESVTRGEASVAIILPRGLGEQMRRGDPVAVQALIDGSDSNRAIVAQNALSAFALKRAMSEAEAGLGAVAASRGQAASLPRINVEPRVLYNPTLNSRMYFVPGVAALLLLLVTFITSSAGLTREKELGTLEQVLVSPIRPEVFIVGKTLPYGLIGLGDLGFVVGMGAWIFEVPIRGSLWVLFAAGALYMLSTLGVGLLVSALARTQQQAFMGAFFFLLPATLLSGFITPVENMPEWLQPLTTLTPVRHFVEIMRAVLLKGAGAADLAAQFVALAGLGIVFYGTSAVILRRRLS